MHYDWYLILWVFFIYAVLGWCAEVAFAAVKTRAFVNRGFLNGPYCPIYGFGMVIVVLCLTPIADNIPLLFFGSALLTSLLELVTGYVLEKFFDDKWWDYSGMPLNIHGYICLPFSLMWGVGCVIIMRVLHPLVMKLIALFCNTAGFAAACIFAVLFLTDVGMTVATLLHLKKQIRLVKQINERMHEFSDKLGTGIYEGTIAAMDASEKARTELKEVSEKARTKAADMSEKARIEWKDASEKARMAVADVSEKARMTAVDASEKVRTKSAASAEHMQGKARWEAEKLRIKEEIAASEKKTREELEQLLAKRRFGEQRLLKAFPALRNGKMQPYLDRLREVWKKDDTQKRSKNKE